MEAFLPAGEAPAAAGARAGEPPARICLHSALGSYAMPRTLSMLYMRQERATHCLQCVVLAAFKRPRFKRVGMKRAKKTKIEVKQTEQLTMQQIATTGGGQAPAPATLLHHTSVAAATTARDDKLQGQLEERQEWVWRAKVFDDLCKKEVLKVEKQHDLNVKIFEARLVRWEREERSKKQPPRLSLVLKREDKNTAFLDESEQKVSAVRHVAMDA